MNGSPLSVKERKEVIKGLIAQGGEPRETKHTTLLAFPGGTTIGIPKTSSDWRARKNMRAEVRAAGYVWPLDGPHVKARQQMDEAIARVREAVSNIPGNPDVYKITRYLTGTGQIVGHPNTIKQALRALGYEEIRGRKTGRGYQWTWVRRADAVPAIEEDKHVDIKWADPDEVTTVTPGMTTKEILKEMSKESQDIDRAIADTRGNTGATISQLIRITDEEKDAIDQAIVETRTGTTALPAKLSDDAEWALAEAQRLEARAVRAEKDNERLILRLTDRDRLVRELEDANVTKAERIDDDAATITNLKRELDRMRTDITNMEMEQAHSIHLDDSWETQVDPNIKIGDFIEGAKTYGLEAIIRLRKA